MAKLIIINSEKGEKVETHEDIFKLSNLQQREIYAITNERTKSILLNQTFYTILDIENEPKDKVAFDSYNSLFPTSIFSYSRQDRLFGTCNHVLDNNIHYSFALFDSMVDNLSTYLPNDWNIIKISDSIDYPIGNDLLFYVFDNLVHMTIDQFVNSEEKQMNTVPKCKESQDKIKEVFTDIMSHLYMPAIDYDPQSYNYRVSRREIGNLVRDQVFSLVKGHIHLIGPEMESLRNIIMFLHAGNSITFHTIDTSTKSSYIKELEFNKKTKLTMASVLVNQRKNMNNFFKGLIRHYITYGIPRKVYYIGAYPSYWLELITWVPFNIVAYDPKYRRVDNDKIIWYDRLFDRNDIETIESKSYIYIDIRTDVRNLDTTKKQRIFKEEDDMIVDMAIKLASKQCTVMFKRKIFPGNNMSFGDPLFHPKLTQLGREYYNCITTIVSPSVYKESELYSLLLSARSNNVSNYVYGGSKFDQFSIVNCNSTVVALYSLSNTVNSLKTIEHAIKYNHIITFPHRTDRGDWRNIEELDNSSPFQNRKRQLEFEDWSIDPKNYVMKFRCEMVSESVFLQLGHSRALIPDLYNHMISLRMEMPLFYSDRFFSHIGIRQPSIFKRDSYMTSRLSAYISRQLTHSINLSVLKRNHFEGYSGHLIAIETSFSSLVFTMSPYRWLIRAKKLLTKNKMRDKFKIGDGQPHTREEFENTYDYLKINRLVNSTFRSLLLD
ncbi:VP3 [Adult diarrheal rotavirus strain J19]|uniref:Protein VP3 n=1 Tax=Rotavirus X (strain RVX/Human/China/NADRV-J19/1997/GXP[X]) TaxID=335103 RepID=VP3_ROTJ1|nr:VP3 [Adult diarrheal rotavirus strain J19]Q45UF7.1 RecName: Full=Protein VP3; Includes: RecName: Full=mRNA guanylyltransferase; Includes: RecName: Full=mRNA (guanine-N(7))-methyltransferase [Adult diarrheal rotavirus strain J19]AAZ03488.1 VP3 [Adult diarrheal rotavirus strain J19]